ncbi:MAG: glutamine--tRNA ligase [Elusimicrobiota bacterium]
MKEERPRSGDRAPASAAPAEDFIRESVKADGRAGKNGGRVHTRFPPEPNGYLHIGHAKSICLNFGVAAEFSGRCNLRMDDTNPAKEEVEYVQSIQEDVRWLGFDWEDRLFYASDYFGKLYEYALQLIQEGHAYVCDLSADEVRLYRGTLSEPGKPSPWRERAASENLDLFERMRKGEFPDGARTLRAKIDMASPNLNMRDPAIYRIRHAAHHRTGEQWRIYPMYDYAHCVSDALEGITHSICTLEFEDHRPLYDWFLDRLRTPCHPRQIEFARLNLTYTVMSKRKLLELVKGKRVSGWDDPRMPTLQGLRRRGVSPEAIRTFCEKIGVSKANSTNDIALLENYPEGQVEWMDAVNNPEDPSAGTRRIPFSRVLYIEADDFRETPPKGYYRLFPGNEVRLRYAYLIRCREAVKNEKGEVVELRCTYDPATKGGDAPDGRKVKSTIHWVSADHAVAAEARLYEHLLLKPDADDVPEGEDFLSLLNPKSLERVDPCWAEPALKDAAPGSRWQFERVGYFCADPDSKPGKPVFNRTVTLRDSWAKTESRSQKKSS